ncbi:aspartyl-phosphate phosphatase Spo0E family protein [Paenibacillus sp. M1]|uniref:Aspartyl-phosphate phosphatase Spo0E family protein n=1 Tax=Paenibacillus haidiansis TaxID=1574488 RepID=A0ABU7VTT7_9BACL
MGCGEYNLPYETAGIVIAEGNAYNQWVDDNSQKTSPQGHGLSLEDEIHLLRSKMERIFQQENSFTSDIVIEISSLLDLKINEFMRMSQKGK